MIKDVFIRAATPDDFDRLLNLFDEVAAERGWIGTEPGFDRSAYRAGWNRIVDANGGALFVATDGETIIGTLSVHPDSDHGCEIGTMVKPGYRGAGIGSMLLGHAIDWARARQERTLSLLVFPHNSAAIALYEHFGFEERQRYEGFKKRQNGEVWDVILMVLPL